MQALLHGCILPADSEDQIPHNAAMAMDLIEDIHDNINARTV